MSSGTTRVSPVTSALALDLRDLLTQSLSRTADRVLTPCTRSLGLPDVTWAVEDHGGIVGHAVDITVLQAYADSEDLTGYLGTDVHGVPEADVQIAGRWVRVILGGAL